MRALLSRISPPLAVFAAAALGCLLLVIAEFTPLLDVRTMSEIVKEVGTGSHHSYALIPIALAALAFAWGATFGGSRPALIALGLLGLAAAAIAIGIDLPDTTKEGEVGARYESARAAPRAGLYLETLGAVLLIVAAGAGMLLDERAPDVLKGLEGRKGAGRRDPAAEDAAQT